MGQSVGRPSQCDLLSSKMAVNRGAGTVHIIIATENLFDSSPKLFGRWAVNWILCIATGFSGKVNNRSTGARISGTGFAEKKHLALRK